MDINLQDFFYIVSAALFVFGLKMMQKSESARKGNLISAIGMLVAVITALLGSQILNWQWILLGLAIGSLIGALSSRLVAMTAMPEMVALFNGFGGMASLLVSWSAFHQLYTSGELATSPWNQMVIISLTLLIGGVTFTGSLIAWGKLSGKLTTRPVLFPGQNIVNFLILLALLTAILYLGPLQGVLLNYQNGILSPYSIFIIIMVLSGILGILSVIPIGGGDMPVVISLLNSYSGMAACAAGFVISNNVLIVSGALVGSSGIILTNIMCKAMNRSLTNVLFSGFGAASTGKRKNKDQQGEVKALSVEDAYYLLEAAASVVIVPGYGMAVAQAQHIVQEIAQLLEENGAEVDFAIHPVAGRMPGHMNVLLAEAKVPYDKLREMDDINPRIDQVDVAVVIGANDVVNPAARTDKDSPLYGMPVINVEKAKTVIVLKRSMNTGFAGIDNPLFYMDNTRMLFGDAKATLQALVSELKSK
ncbi:MAG: NAD(P)(+) transhydrogenase (Re/Si-specific) subunit beta [Spirochaetales bacterium]|nr:NAD(P)(+) transhydrogenase (Re/Si-specific) subunit beta [Spirochaetales bacterium]